ncbi:hypothetical protein TRFO_23494 [Tritrichomonas foetus]|uniref:Uncharacterized protein n=1 Tax=Tritrichomonas foetus TaxID=1144522 RepID=A0A1J4K9M4_9EUKA|nr:hypothetical protein TRFO_23494 [Tritrichomonas foetus]|eukprot:OHT08127.1 hypothetical protein TRFO_23494 [Tritrichomonas foetus]
MSSAAPRGGTVSIPYIYLKARSHRLIPTKKAHFPNSFETLMKICNRLFKSIGVVRSLFNSEGKLVTTIEEVLPGSTIYVSSLDPDGIKESQNIGIWSQISEMDRQGKYKDYDVEYFDRYYKPNTTINIADVESQHSIHSEIVDIDAYSLSSHSTVPIPKKQTESDMGLSNHNEEEDLLSDASSGLTKSSQKYYSNTFDQISQRSARSNRPSPCLDLINLFEELIGTDKLNNKIEPGFLQLLDWMQRLLGPSINLEKEQLERWFLFTHAIRDQQGIPSPDTNMTGFSKIQELVKNTISRHRFFTTRINDYNVRIAITGPRESGKTQLLSVFSDEILLDYAVTGNWKHTFFMFLNFRIINTFIANPELLYRNIIDLTLQAAAWQKPTLSKFIPLIRKTFYMVTSTKAPPRFQVSSTFYQENTQLATTLQKIVNNFSDLWNDEDAMTQWMTSTYMFPSAFANAIGYTKLFFFIDNFEYADVEVPPAPPFSESVPASFNIEYVQFALSNANFVVTCEDQKKMLTALSPLEGGVDIYKGIDVITPMNLCQDEDESDNRVIVMDIQGEALPFLLSIDHCCGIPAYLSIWNELNDVFDEFEDQEEDQQEESKMLLMTFAQHAVDVLFASNDAFEDDEDTQKSKALFVTSVRRSAKECEQQNQ